MKKTVGNLKIVALQLFVILGFFTIISCSHTSNSNSDTNQISAEEETPELLQQLDNNTEAEIPVIKAAEQPVESTSSVETEETNLQVKLNPRHGEPGHRCDIAVGAPLDSPVKSTTSQTTIVNNATPVNPIVNSPASISTSTNASSGRVGPTIEKAKNFVPTQQNPFIPVGNTSGSQTAQLNPPHGQPGHRCDIAVGAPLTSTTNSTVRLNPAHGQPGHRCDIAVGDPLPS